MPYWYGVNKRGVGETVLFFIAMSLDHILLIREIFIQK